MSRQLELMIAKAKTRISERDPSHVLARFAAYNIVGTASGSTLMVLTFDGADVAMVRIYDDAVEWTPIGGKRSNQLAGTLSDAAAAYLGMHDDPAGAGDVVLGGLARGAHNGVAACMAARTAVMCR